MVYNIENQLSFELKVPKTSFGEENSGRDRQMYSVYFDEEEDDEENDG